MRRVLLPNDLWPRDLELELVAIGDDCYVAEGDLAMAAFLIPPYLNPVPALQQVSRMPRLEVVQLLSAGYDVALDYVPSDVTLCNAQGVHDASTAELAMALTLASLRGIDEYARQMGSGQWSSERRESLADKRVIVIGAGGIGRAIAARMASFQTDVALVARTARTGVHAWSSLDDMLPSADIVVVALPLSSDTTGLIGRDFLSRMPDHSLLVNVGRGAVVDTVAMTAEVAAGRIRVALDVTDPEPLPVEHPLWLLPGVLITPHVGGNTSAFLPRAQRLVESQLRRWSLGQPLQNVVARSRS